MARTGRPRAIDPAWATSEHSRGRSTLDIAAELQVTDRAVRKAIQAHRARSGERPAPEFPWAVLSKHATGSMYQTLTTLRHLERGVPLSDPEKVEVAPLIQLLQDQDVVVSYHPKRRGGFCFVPRRDNDDPETFFQRRVFDDEGQLPID